MSGALLGAIEGGKLYGAMWPMDVLMRKVYVHKDLCWCPCEVVDV